MKYKFKNGGVVKLQNAGNLPAFQRAVTAVQNGDTQAIEQAKKEAELLQQQQITQNYNRLHNISNDIQFVPSNGGTITKRTGPLYANKLEKYLDETASGQEMVRMADTAKKAAGLGLGVAGGGWLIKGLKTAPLLISGEFLSGAATGKLGQITGKGMDDVFGTRNQILDFEKTLPFVGMIGGAKAGRNFLENNTLRGAIETGFKNFKFTPETVTSRTKDYVPSQDFGSTYHYDPRVDLLSRPISTAERVGVPKGKRNQIVKPNPNAGAESQIDTYAINRAYDPWEIKDGKFVFKMGEPIATRGDYSEVKTPVTFHFTTDTQVKPHSGMDSWANAKTTYMVPWKSIVKHNGQPANIEPMDTWWTAGSTFEFPIKGVKVLTADPKTYRQYKLQGVDVEFSPEGRKSIQEGTGMRDIVEDWIRKVQDKTGMRPTTDTYRLMEQETGLISGVTGKKVQSPGSSFIQEETNIPEYYGAPPTHSNSWSADSMTPVNWFGDKEVQNSNFINSIVKGIANDLDSYGTFTEKDLPALQKLVQNNKVFDKQLPITFGRHDQYRYNYAGKEELVDKINRILRGEIVIPYKQGGVLKGQEGIEKVPTKTSAPKELIPAKGSRSQTPPYSSVLPKESFMDKLRKRWAEMRNETKRPNTFGKFVITREGTKVVDDGGKIA